MSENKIKAIDGFIRYLENEEEFSGNFIDKLRELVNIIMDLFIRFEEEK